MRNDETGFALHQIVHGLLNEDFRPGVNVRGGFVQNQEISVGQKRTGNGEKLSLSAGHVRTTFVDHGVVAFGKGFYEVVAVCVFAGPFHLFLGNVISAVGDVFENRSAKEPCVLQNHAEKTSDAVSVGFFYVFAADQNLAFLHVVEAHKEVDDCRLSRARRADDCHFLAFFGREIEVLNERFVFRIGKIHSLKFHVAVGGFGHFVGLRLHFLGV